MDTHSHWKAWVDARTPAAAERVAARIGGALGLQMVDLAIKHDAALVASWTCLHEATTGDALVVAVTGAGQRVATGWLLLGSVADELEGIASTTARSRISIAGVTMLTWQISVR